MTGIIELLIILAIVGLVAWVIVTMIPMPAPIQKVIIVVAVLLCILIVVRALGISMPNVRLDG